MISARIGHRVLALGILSFAVFADVATWQRYMDEANSAHDKGDYDAAERAYRAAFKEVENIGAENPAAGVALKNLADLYQEQGRYAEAEPLHKRALGIFEKALGDEDPAVASSLNSLAELYRTKGRYAEVEPLLQRALAINGQALGPAHPNVAESLNNLALLHSDQGRYTEAEPLQKRALAIYEQALGPTHLHVAISLSNLAGIYLAQGRYTEAEPLYQRALAINELTSGPAHPHIATALNNLAQLYADQGRYAEAESLYQRALSINEQALGPTHPHMAGTLNNLAMVYEHQGRYADAELLFQRALVINEQVFGLSNPDVAASLNNLALLYSDQGRLAEAEPLHRRALAIKEHVLGPSHPDVATSLSNLSALYVDQGRTAEAEPLLQRALAIREQSLDVAHPDVAVGLNNLAVLYDKEGRDQDALALARRAAALLEQRGVAAALSRSSGAQSQQAGYRWAFFNLVQMLAQSEEGEEAPRAAESFMAGQQAQVGGAAEAVARMAARFASGDDALAGKVRERQDAVNRWQALDGLIIKAVSAPQAQRNAEAEKNLRAEQQAIDQKLKALDAELSQSFPEYQELASPAPVALAEAQSLLGEDEALVSYLIGDEQSFLWVVRKDQAAFQRLEIDVKTLAETVKRLRGQLDPSEVERLEDIRTFDVQGSHELYKKVFAPAEPLLVGAKRVMVVADGALQSLPLAVLVTEAPAGPIADFPDYRQVAWLGNQYALTTLPSVSSLRALRRFAKREAGGEPFTGFGDPLLEGESGPQRGPTVSALFSRGAIANVEEVRALPRLPETAGELYAMAASLKAARKDVHVGAAATEGRLKGMDLSPFRTVAFSTHGLMSGEFKGLAEPALVLTPPVQGTEQDDGLLTASEVAQLKLNAEWVVLSACNTAAPDGTPGAEGLSGLARAYFYAGSRALLVSHWPVSSEATVALTTQLFAAPATTGKAEALQGAMRAVMNDAEHPYYAHPMFWAPFVVVGEGAR